jgi:hypothetical protein
LADFEQRFNSGMSSFIIRVKAVVNSILLDSSHEIETSLVHFRTRYKHTRNCDEVAIDEPAASLRQTNSSFFAC